MVRVRVSGLAPLSPLGRGGHADNPLTPGPSPPRGEGGKKADTLNRSMYQRAPRPHGGGAICGVTPREDNSACRFGATPDPPGCARDSRPTGGKWLCAGGDSDSSAPRDFDSRFSEFPGEPGEFRNLILLCQVI